MFLFYILCHTFRFLCPTSVIAVIAVIIAVIVVIIDVMKVAQYVQRMQTPIYHPWMTSIQTNIATRERDGECLAEVISMSASE